MPQTKGKNRPRSKSGPKYRSIRENLPHDPAFQALSVYAKALFLILKCEGKASGIFVQYRPTLALLTSLNEAQLDAAITEMRDAGFLETEGSVYWLIRSLEEDPHLNVKSEESNHKAPIMDHLAQLPALEIANRYADYYGLPLPFPRLRTGSSAPAAHQKPAIAHQNEPSAHQPTEKSDAESVEISEAGLLGLVRSKMYVNKKEPQAGSAARDRTVIRALLEKGVEPIQIAEAIEGLSLMRDHDKLDTAGPSAPITMRLLYNTQFGALSLFTEARDYRRQVLGKAAGDTKRLRDLVAKALGDV